MTKRLLILNGLAALGVVMYHSTGHGFTAMFWWADRYRDVGVPIFDQVGSPAYFGLRLIEQGVIFAIPAFVFLSGFFISVATGRNQKTVSWTVVLGRIRKLAIPFLFWSLLLMGVDLLMGKSITPVKFISALLTGRSEPPYYYVPMLIQLFLLSPFLVWWTRKNSKTLLAVSVILQVVFLLTRYVMILELDIPVLHPLVYLTRSYLFTSQIFWFVFGLVSGFHVKEFKVFIYRNRYVFLSLAMIGFLAGLFEWEYLLKLSGKDVTSPQETIIDQVYSLGFILSFLAFEKLKIPLERPISSLAGRSYGIYLIHSPILRFVATAVYHLTPVLLGYQILFQPLLIGFGLAIPLVFMAIVNRSPARRFYEYLFG